MKDGKIYYEKIDGKYIIKIIDAIKYSNITGFDTFIEIFAQDSSLKALIIDLREATYIDSTNLGLIVKIANITHKKIQQLPLLVSSNDRIDELLREVGFDKLFKIVKHIDYSPRNLKEIKNIELGEVKRAKTILTAHENISAINDKNRQKFKDVVDFFNTQLHKKPRDL